MDRTKRVRIAYGVRPERFEVTSPTRALASTPSDVPDPTAVENLERPCGRGLMLMRHYMTEVASAPRQLVRLMQAPQRPA